jgi:hypothetical protein
LRRWNAERGRSRIFPVTFRRRSALHHLPAEPSQHPTQIQSGCSPRARLTSEQASNSGRVEPSGARLPRAGQMPLLRLWIVGALATLYASVGLAQTPRVQPQGENLSAGKTPAELFAIDCSSCHRSPTALAKGRRAAQLSNFLAEHYTSSRTIARMLGTYLANLPTAPTAVERTQAPPATDNAGAAAGSRAPVEAPATQPPADTAPAPGTVVAQPPIISQPVPQTLDTLEVYD